MQTHTLRTPLYEHHQKAGAKIVDFAGWEMPVEYSGIRKEHEAVRTGVGLFDLSHMGEVTVHGFEAMAYLQLLITNDLTKIEPYRAQYTCMCKNDGTVLDDMIIYRYPEHFLVVMNASNRDKIIAWMLQHAPEIGVELEDRSMKTALIAIQGPLAQALLAPHSSVNLDEIRYYAFQEGSVHGIPALISRTGYTGEDGFELYLDWDRAGEMWDFLMGLEGVCPIGLGARDTLRLESGYALYGHELDETVTPYDAGLAWVVKLDKPAGFVGRDALVKQKETGQSKTIVGLTMDSRAIPREGYPVLSGDRVVGKVTSGTFSPSLKKGIALASVEKSVRAEGTQLSVEVRGRLEPATVVKPPFVRGSVRRG